MKKIVSYLCSLFLVCSMSLSSINTYAANTTWWSHNGIKVDKASPRPENTPIKLMANVGGNKSGLKYKFVWMKNNWKQWGVIRQFNGIDNITWRPPSEGNYTFYLDIQDTKGRTVTKTLNYRVNKKSVARPVQPKANPQKPATKPAQPKANPQKPATKPAQPKANPQKPAARPAQPKPNTQKPAAKPVTPKSNNVQNSTKTGEKYVGIQNPKNACSLITALQLLYHNQEFRNIVLSLNNRDLNSSPYLTALNRQFKQMSTSNNGSFTRIEFSQAQINNLITASNGANYNQMTGDWAETKLLTTCMKELEAKGNRGLANRIKALFNVDNSNQTVVLQHLNRGFNYDLKSSTDKLPKTPSTLNVSYFGGSQGFNYNSHSSVNIKGKNYKLSGVLIWTGNHFYALVQDKNTKEWYELNDWFVIKRSVAQVEAKIKYSANNRDQALQFVYD